MHHLKVGMLDPTQISISVLFRQVEEHVEEHFEASRPVS